MNSDADWAASARQFQQDLGAQWTKAMQSAHGGLQPPAATALDAAPLRFSQGKLAEVRQAYVREAAQLWNQAIDTKAAAPDKRFAADAWRSNPVAAYTAALYLLNARALLGLADAAETDAKTRSRLRFAVEQWMAASAPSNFMALNAEAQRKALETKGESIARGVQNLLKDIQQGHVSMTDESVFEVGRNVATTEGAVVYENELFQLIEYKPLTTKIYERPFLVVPPCINKFYILDLQPANSVVRHLSAQGHRTFLVSWRNPDASLGDKTWDDYVGDGAIEAIERVRDITGAKQLNALGFCVGGTILGTALAVLAARGEKPVAALTLLTSFLDFADTGVLDVFIDEAFVRLRETQFASGGLMPGRDLATTFSFLRPNDLVWNYVVGNYLKGETPPPFDLLYWNSDSTNLPGPMFAWYLRNTYLENNLVKPGRCIVCGEAVDLRKLDMPVYIYGSREDHIVPIRGAYLSTRWLPGRKRFVMGASGHIAGVINPPAANKRSYWTNERLPRTHEEWLAGAQEHAGSWWPDWTGWLKSHAGRQIAAPKRYGNARYRPIEPAPGRYVRARA
jgi:polyhydroxyalkanoate synthase subunit PhaC